MLKLSQNDKSKILLKMVTSIDVLIVIIILLYYYIITISCYYITILLYYYIILHVSQVIKVLINL
jgi:hypothetical protein